MSSNRLIELIRSPLTFQLSYPNLPTFKLLSRSLAARILQSKEQPAAEKPFLAVVATVGADEQQRVEKIFPYPSSSRPPHFCAIAIGAADAPLLPGRSKHEYPAA